MNAQTRHSFVAYLPDLMGPADYETAHERKLLRVRLLQTDAGLEIIGDSAYPDLLDELLARLDPRRTEMMLCG